MDEVPLKWTSRVVKHTTFKEALASIKRPDTKVIYGLDEAQMLLMNEAEVADESKTHFYVTGDAIHATTTRNLHKFLAEELEVSAKTLANRPVMVDHGKGSLDNAGKVLVTSWESRGGLDSAITYVARIRKSHPVAEAVATGDIDTVSVGATASLIECSICQNDMHGEKCNHRIGRKYEIDDTEVVATAIGRGLTFRELSITPFPADEHASAHVTTNSIFTAMEMWVESSEVKPNLSGVMKKMVEDTDVESNKALDESVRKEKEMQEELDRINKEKTEFAEKVKELQTNEVNDLVEQVVDIGIKANLYKVDDIVKQKEDLKKLTAETLREKLSDYKRVHSLIERPPDVKSTAVVGDSPVMEQTPVKGKLIYSKEELKSGLREALGGLKTSPYAKQVMQKNIAFDAYNPNRERYLRIFAENSEAARRRE